MKVPKLFPVRIPENRFQSLILKRVYTMGDRDYLLGLYRLEADGSRVRAEELPEQDAKRLAGLARSIARNRGAVQVPKLVLLAVIVAVVLAFNFFFKNALLTRALVAGLESVFEARAEVAGLDFRLLAGRISIRQLAVADRDQPMRNLFELGGTELSLETLRLLEGRVHVRNLACRDVRWHTPRSFSGALSETGAAAPAPEGGEGGLKKAARSILRQVDLAGFVEEQSAALSSAAKLEAANQRLEGLTAKWKTTLANSRSELEALSPQIEQIRRFDDAQELLAALQTTGPRVQSLASTLSSASRQLEADRRSVQAEQAALQAAIGADVAVLKAKLDLSGGGWKSLASDLSAHALRRYLGKYASWVSKAADAGQALARGKGKAKKDRPLARRGRLITFPGAAAPRFLLSQAAFSIAEGPQLPGIEAAGRDITSEPELLGRPISLEASAAKGGRSLSLAGAIDTRARRELDAVMELSAENWDLRLQEGLESVGVGSLAATAGLRTDFRLLPGGAAEGEGSLNLRSLVLQPQPADDPVGRAVAETLAAVPQARLDFTFTMERGGPAKVTVRTDLDDALWKAAGAQAGRLASQYEQRLRAEVSGRLEAQLARNEALASSLAELQKAAGGDLAAAGSYAQVLAEARKSLEKKLKTTVPLPKLGF